MEPAKIRLARRLIAHGWSLVATAKFLRLDRADMTAALGLTHTEEPHERAQRDARAFVARQLERGIAPRVLYANFGDMLTREECGL